MVLIAEYFDPHYTPFWTILQQVGVEGAISRLDRRFDGDSNSGDRYEEAGLDLVGIEDCPPMDKIRLGLPGRDEEIEAVCTLLRTLGKLEIPMLCYNWMACINWVRTEIARPGRGGAKVTAFRRSDLGDPGLTWAGEVAAQQLWHAWEYFMDIAVPVAEKAGVRLALHPDDPPIGEVRGIARIMNSVESYNRAMAYREAKRTRSACVKGISRSSAMTFPGRSATSATRADLPSVTSATCRAPRSTLRRHFTTRA